MDIFTFSKTGKHFQVKSYRCIIAAVLQARKLKIKCRKFHLLAILPVKKTSNRGRGVI